ncbi:8160_t:CDS:1, partial [Funneliformis caledonium]
MKETKATKRCSKVGTHTLECNDDDNSQELSVYDYEKYKKSYGKMNDANKWVLTTGT